ncbi:hypothetical protein MTY_2540 [Moorella thermoacetica Y72]|uniref:Uncharacterized protein n=1 Tax=Moorella thermoacetica Y72 TaxID=1325331 RepID=A0A0S6UFA3_NEOTH|nr:hypothetical protein MTY_2540 [Moorella thermoacetica Y72]
MLRLVIDLPAITTPPVNLLLKYLLKVGILIAGNVDLCLFLKPLPAGNFLVLGYVGRGPGVPVPKENRPLRAVIMDRGDRMTAASGLR